MNLYLDTSAVNRLYDAPDSAVLAKGIQERAIVFPSVFVIAELCSESDHTRRDGLLALLKRLSRGYRPAAMPGELLKRSVEVVSRWGDDMDQSMGPSWEGIWAALDDPSLIDKDSIEEVKSWKQHEEDLFQHMHDRGRPEMQKAIESLAGLERTHFITSFTGMIRFYSLRSDLLRNMVIELITKSGADVSVDDGLVERVITHSEHWRFFLAAMAYGIYARSLRQTKFSKKKNPGNIDTQQAIYLAICDTFVTADNQQRRMLRFVVPFGHTKRKVCSFQEFEKFLYTNDQVC